MPRRLIMLIALPLAAACASTDSVRAPDIDLPAAYQSDPATAAAPVEAWWLAFDDEQLIGLIQEALRNAPEAELAFARLEEARATRLANIRSAFPTGALVGAASARGSDQVSGPENPFSGEGVILSQTLGFDVSWEADIWGKTRAARRGVEADFAAKVFNIESARAALAANVADSLFAARGLMEQWVEAQESARIAREVLRLAELRAANGLVPGADVRRARADVAQAEAAVLQLQAELNVARRSLLVLIGRGTDRLETLPILLSNSAPPPPPPAVPGDLLQRRPDIREAEQRLLTAIAQLEVDRRNLFPRFTIMPGVGLTRSTNPNSPVQVGDGFAFRETTTVTADWSIGVGLNVPVLDRPRLLAVARASDARAEQAVINYEAMVQRAYGEVENALLQLEADRDRLALLDVGAEDARAAYEAARLRYEAGLDDLTTLLSAESAWRNSRAAAVAARTQVQRRTVQVFKAMGGGWAPGDDFEV